MFQALLFSLLQKPVQGSLEVDTGRRPGTAHGCLEAEGQTIVKLCMTEFPIEFNLRTIQDPTEFLIELNILHSIKLSDLKQIKKRISFIAFVFCLLVILLHML